MTRLGELLNFVRPLWFTKKTDYMRKAGSFLVYLGIPKSSEVWKKNFFFIIWRQHKQTASEPEIPFYYFFEFLRLVLKLQCFDWSSPFMAHLVNWCGLANWNSSPRWTSLDSYKFHLKGVCYFTEPSKGTVWFWYSLEVSYIFVSWVIHFHH